EAAAGGRKIDAIAVHFWEVMAHLRWAVIALQQADRHISGQQRSLELALTGRILPELELTIIDLIAPGPWPKPAATLEIGQPDGAGLLAEARRSLSEDLLGQLPEPRRYEARMIANAMAIAGRELAALPAASSQAKTLARDIREGRYDKDEDLRDRLAAGVLAQLAISNPKVLPRT
ncbi:MAG TPA: hypothetical protein VHQ39_10260, partial [Dongiaceae bacterium]|nr:hypothetical protein [Dongiaceae bacterium]